MRESDKNKDPFLTSHDQQITQTLHDEIVVWIYKKTEKPNDLVSELTGVSRENLIRVERKLEFPFSTFGYGGSRYVKGFADLKIEGVFEEEAWVKWEGRPKTLEVYTRSHSCFIEVKSFVNLGETIRQINYYKACPEGDGRWAVCAPPFAQSIILEEQGIKFIPYEPEYDF